MSNWLKQSQIVWSMCVLRVTKLGFYLFLYSFELSVSFCKWSEVFCYLCVWLCKLCAVFWQNEPCFQNRAEAIGKNCNCIWQQTCFCTCLVLLDLSASFDTIDHQILLQRLEHFIAIKGTALNWFKSYLSDRLQFVHVNSNSFMYAKVRHGVPQGSVLGPIQYIVQCRSSKFKLKQIRASEQ